jgi:hypothetical protein
MPAVRTAGINPAARSAREVRPVTRGKMKRREKF